MKRQKLCFAYIIRTSIVALFLFFSALLAQAPLSSIPGADEPVKYIGKEEPSKVFYDGHLRHVLGVHSYQVLRANRRHSPEGDAQGWTYNHQPFLAYWRGRFYLQYLSDPYQEHTPPGRTLIVTSENGRHWSNPKVVFPEYVLPEINYQGTHIPAGMKSVMHQRMGFYVAPNGRLLTLAFYGYSATPHNSPNTGNGLGRVVREIYSDGSFGPIYFIRYNRHAGWNESNTRFPFYKESKDSGFLAACDSLLANKLITLQWWEEDRAKDGFYVIDPGAVKNAAYFSSKITTSKGAGKAFNFFHRKDGVVGLWKNQWSALSPDNGKHWTKITKNKSLWTDGAKTWGQRTEDGRFAIVHNQSATHRNRFPMTVMTSDDGHMFSNLLCVVGEVPPQRFQGLHKNTGTQYYRGIIEGNGNPPGKEMWIVYSVNKEDIWISRIRVPISGQARTQVNQDFQTAGNESDLSLWNLYMPRWAPIHIVEDPFHPGNKVLEVKDEAPYDYARAERKFPESRHIQVSFRINPVEVAQGHYLAVEVQSSHGDRPMRLRFDRDWLALNIKKISAPNPVRIQTKKWYTVKLNLDCGSQSYHVSVNGKPVGGSVPFAERVESVERIVFRTGPYRGFVPPAIEKEGVPKPAGLDNEDLPGADEKAPLCRYWIDDLATAALDE